MPKTSPEDAAIVLEMLVARNWTEAFVTIRRASGRKILASAIDDTDDTAVDRAQNNRQATQRFIQRQARAAHAACAVPYAVAWQMLMCEPTRPQTVIGLYPQIAYFVAQATEAHTETTRQVYKSRLVVWRAAADGHYGDHRESIFELQHSEAEDPTPLPEEVVATMLPEPPRTPLPRPKEPPRTPGVPSMIVVPRITAASSPATRCSIRTSSTASSNSR